MAFGLFKKKTYADTVYRNGFLHTLDAETEDATAVACKDGKVMRVGLDEEIEPLIGPDTEVVDLKGRFLVPGFIDLYGSPAAQVLEGSYLRLHAGLSAEEATAAIEAWAAEHAPCEFVLAYGWFSDEEELPVLDEVCPDVPVLIIGEDSVGMRMNRTAQQMVKERAEAETFAVAVTPNFVFNTIVALDYAEMSRKAFVLAEDYAKRGYTSVLNLEICTYFDNLYRNLLLDLFQAGLIKQRYFGSLPLKRMLTPMSVMYNLDRKRTACSELQGLVNFDMLTLTASSAEQDATYMTPAYLKEMCGTAADKGYSIRLNALDKEITLQGMEVLGTLSTAYRKCGFNIAFDEVISDEEKADVYTGDVFETPLTGALPLTGDGEAMLSMRTENAARRMGAGFLGTIEEGKSADFAVFSVDPCSLSTAEEFEALRADLTVLAGSVVYDSTLGEGAADWFRDFDATLEEVYSEVGTEEE